MGECRWGPFDRPAQYVEPELFDVFEWGRRKEQVCVCGATRCSREFARLLTSDTKFTGINVFS